MFSESPVAAPLTMAAVATLPCTLSSSMPENMNGMKLYSNCDLLEGGACNACKDYLALEAKISAARTNQALDDLLSQRPDMRTRVNQNHDLLTTSVPLEIVCSVFQFSVPEKWSFDDFNNADPKSRDKQIISAPLLLGSICRTWRNIAWGMKPLWTLLTLNLARRLDNPDSVALAREWLDRAGQLRLSISIRNSNAPDSPRIKYKSAIAAQMFALVNERSEQWEYLDMIDFSVWTSLLTGSLGGAPNLRALKLGHLFDAGFSLTGSRPRPCYLYLDSCRFESIKIECNNLTYVCLSYFDLDDFVELLRRAPKLVDCRVEIDHEPLEVDIKIPAVPTIHQSLESIEFSSFFDTTAQPEPPVVTLFKSFIFPNMKHLKIDSCGTSVDTDDLILWDPVVTNIANSSPLLISFAILHPGLQRSIIPILQRTPLLRDLEMFGPVYASGEGEEIKEDDLFNLLADTSIVADDNVQTNFLPNLQSIKFHLSANEVPDTFWDTVSGIFGPLSEIHNPRRRPLTTLCVRDEIVTDEVSIKSKDAALRLLRLRREGVILDLKGLGEKMDLLEYAIEKHGLRDWLDGEPQPR